MDDGQKIEYQIRIRHLAVGIPIMFMGSSLQAVAFCLHDFTPQMIVRGISALMMVGGFAIMIRGFLKAREARVGKGN